MTSRSIWMPEVRAVLTQLTGTVTALDVEHWIAGLDAALATIPDGTEIVVLADLQGDDRATDLARTRLAALETHRITCSKIAHVHPDAPTLAARATPRERFFTSAAFANEWLLFD